MIAILSSIVIRDLPIIVNELSIVKDARDRSSPTIHFWFYIGERYRLCCTVTLLLLK